MALELLNINFLIDYIKFHSVLIANSNYIAFYFLYKFLKNLYSNSHVGSGLIKTFCSSFGMPDGNTLSLTINFVGPHLHKELIWAVPFSAKISHVK